MSGSSGVGFGIGGASSSVDCNIVEKTLLNSPSAAVIPTLKKGDTLTVAVSPSGKSLLVNTSSGSTAGSLTPRNLADLLECIQQRGKQYVAHVIDIAGAKVTVEIRPK